MLVVIKYAPNTERGFSNLEASFATDGRDYCGGVDQLGRARGPLDAGSDGRHGSRLPAGRRCAASCTASPPVTTGPPMRRADGRQHADHPASSPHAVACGGTRLIAEDGRRISEEAWNELRVGQGATGRRGQRSLRGTAIPVRSRYPPASVNDGRHGRGVPDVAGNADPLTGYVVHHRGVDSIVGGTSAVAPLWTALFARGRGGERPPPRQRAARPVRRARRRVHRRHRR